MNARFRVALHPVPEVGRVDTSLRFTDILFGFVIRELFLRIQNWPQLDAAVRWHLIIGTVLVLGSWIGFRRSLNRSAYEVKFFNLPFLRFIVDQGMLILYFRIAALTVEGKQPPLADALARMTGDLVVYIFSLYVVWDLLGIWMATATAPAGHGAQKKPLYPAVKDGQMTDERQRADWQGFFISFVSLLFLVFLRLAVNCLGPNGLFLGIAALLLAYRCAKEMRTSWRGLPRG